MYFNELSSVKEFKQDVYDKMHLNIGINTVKMEEYYTTVLVSTTQLQEITEIIKKFDVEFEVYDEHKKYGKLAPGEKVIQFFVNFPSEDNKERERFKDLAYEFWRRSIKYSPYFPEFEDLNEEEKTAFNDYFLYFIVSERDLEETREVVHHFLNIDINPVIVESFNGKSGVDNLYYFKVIEKSYFRFDSHIRWKISGKLSSCNIDHFIYEDKDGNDSLVIMAENKDSRISSVGFRKDLGTIFKSTWEANFARILNYSETIWEYEKKHFTVESNGDKIPYIPDFFLNDNTIVEIKGFWDNHSVKKVNLFKEQYKEYKLFIIDSDMYYTLDKIYSDVIENWEDSHVVANMKQKIPVIGLTFGNRKQVVNTIKLGDELFMKRDSNNPYDENAILVLNKEEKEVGFVSKEWASIYAEKLDVGMTYKCIVVEKQPKVINIEVQRMNIDDPILFEFIKYP